MTHYQEPRRGRPRLQGQGDVRDKDDAEVRVVTLLRKAPAKRTLEQADADEVGAKDV